MYICYNVKKRQMISTHDSYMYHYTYDVFIFNYVNFVRRTQFKVFRYYFYHCFSLLLFFLLSVTKFPIYRVRVQFKVFMKKKRGCLPQKLQTQKRLELLL